MSTIAIRNQIANFFALGILIALIFFMIYAGLNAGLNFDVAYNLLSYRSLFDGNGFLYNYNGQELFFNPTISTGPELYLPVYLLWKLIGKANYDIATMVFIGYYFLFLLFQFRYVTIDSYQRLLGVLLFSVFYFSIQENFYNAYGFIAPLGEAVSIFFIFFGIFFLHQKRYYMAAFLFGLALDIKSNVFIGLLPTLAIFWISFIVKRIRNDQPYSERFLSLPIPGLLIKSSYVLLWFILLFGPYLTSNTIIPAITLEGQQLATWKEAKIQRTNFMLSNGFGQWLVFKTAPSMHDTLIQYSLAVSKKVIVLKTFTGSKVVAVILFFGSLIILSIVWRKHFVFWLILYYFFTTLWWISSPLDGWHRYYYSGELAWMLAVTAAAPATILQRDGFIAKLCIAALVIIAISRMAPEKIFQAIDMQREARQQLKSMAQTLEDKPGAIIFTYGWFQCPQLMLLTGKWFFDYQDNKTRNEIPRASPDAFFLVCPETNIVAKKVDPIISKLQLTSQQGPYRLFTMTSTQQDTPHSSGR